MYVPGYIFLISSVRTLKNRSITKIYPLKISDPHELRELFVEQAKRKYVAPKRAQSSIPQIAIINDGKAGSPQ